MGRKDGSLVQVIKRGLAILGPQQLVVISNTHTENHLKKERRKPWLTNEKMDSYSGSSTGSTHKQHSHTMQTQRII